MACARRDAARARAGSTASPPPQPRPRPPPSPPPQPRPSPPPSPPSGSCVDTIAASPRFRFAELFSGVGGFRLGLEAAGGACVFSCEYCRFACATYRSNFGVMPVGDIRKIAAAQVPRHDVLAAGFPCQSFSNAGRLGGFDDARGELFYELVRIVRGCQPPALLLENVRGLLTRPDALAEVLRALAEAGYAHAEVAEYDAALLVPQRRRRVFIVCFRDVAAWRAFVWPALPALRRVASDVLEFAAETRAPRSTELELSREKWHKVASSAYYSRFPGARLLPHRALAQTLQTTYRSGFLLYSQFVPQAAAAHPDSSTAYGDAQPRGPRLGPHAIAMDSTEDAAAESEGAGGAPDGGGRGGRRDGGAHEDDCKGPPPPRFFSPRECARLMGFPERFALPKADGLAYRQLGNAVVPPLVGALAVAVVHALEHRASHISEHSDGAHNLGAPSDGARGDGACSDGACSDGACSDGTRGGDGRSRGWGAGGGADDGMIVRGVGGTDGAARTADVSATAEAVSVALRMTLAACPASAMPTACWLPRDAVDALQLRETPMSDGDDDDVATDGAAYHPPLDDAAWTRLWVGPLPLALVLKKAERLRCRLRVTDPPYYQATGAGVSLREGGRCTETADSAPERPSAPHAPRLTDQHLHRQLQLTDQLRRRCPAQTLPTPTPAAKAEVAARCMRRYLMASTVRAVP